MKTFSNFDLTKFNSYRIPAVCANAFIPESESDILTLYRDRPDVPKVILGDGNNVIFSRDYYTEDFLIMNGDFGRINVRASTITAEAGATLLELSQYACEKELSGLEVFYDIPGSVGGSVVMNAGAGGEDIRAVLDKVRYFDPENLEFLDIICDDVQFGYRNSFFQQNPQLLVSKVWLKLKPGVRALIQAKMDDLKKARWAKQPRQLPNAGSVFKRPKGAFVGPMIEELGLKGFQIGGARVSEKHAGFIVNMGGASGEDILSLISHIKQAVWEHFGVDLEVEQRVV